MAERVKKYLEYIENLLSCDAKDIDWEQEMKKHLVQIGFFAHERIIHLIVTVTFAILTVIVILYTIANFTIPMLLLVVAFMTLMIPYIRHYYLLENSVQRMYEQYDEMQSRVSECFHEKTLDYVEFQNYKK